MSAERRWVAIEHVPCEGPAAIATAAAERGLELEVGRPYLGEALPAPGELAGLVVMGGPARTAVLLTPAGSGDLDPLARSGPEDLLIE